MTKQTGIHTPSIIAADVVIEGNVQSSGELQLDGAINGDLTCGNLVMGETGSVNGQVIARDVVVRGQVTGEIQANTVRLEKSAIVDGDVYHESLAVEAGARLTGRFCHRSGQDSEQPISDDQETPAFLNKSAAE